LAESEGADSVWFGEVVEESAGLLLEFIELAGDNSAWADVGDGKTDIPELLATAATVTAAL